jgi:hypothetical protein
LSDNLLNITMVGNNDDHPRTRTFCLASADGSDSGGNEFGRSLRGRNGGHHANRTSGSPALQCFQPTG